MTLIDVGKIQVGRRHRSDLGDLKPLMDSIEEVGLLHPIVITDSYELVAGQRRLEAVRKLGHEEIEVRVLPLSPAEMLRAEFDENEVRMDFTPTERVAIGRAIEAEVAKQKADNRTANLPQREDSPHWEKGPTRDIVGKRVGWSGYTYERAKKVVEAAEQDSERFGDLPERMDQTGTVNSAYQEMEARQEGAGSPTPGPKPRLGPINSAATIVSKVSHSLDAAVLALEKIDLDGAEKEEVAGWIGDLEDPLRRIRKTVRSWKERV